MIDGVLIVDKPVGPTSHDVVACARRALGISRVGHTGTLDPNASGVLPLVLGRATRLAQFMSGRDKEYLATVRFGTSTDTYDAVGTIVSDSGLIPTRDQVDRALLGFRGTFSQMPPAHSAKKVGGVRAYKHARAAEPVALRPAMVTVSTLDVLDMQGAELRLRVACSAGFYVRSLAHDLGVALGTGALLQALVRTRSGVFTLDEAVPLSTLTPEQRSAATAAVRSMDTLLLDVHAVRLTPDGARRARHGQPLTSADWTEASAEATGVQVDFVRLLDPDGHLLGLARPGDVTGILHPSLVLG